MTTTRTRGLLAVIDMQIAFQDPSSEWFTPRYNKAAENVAKLAKDFGGDTIWTKFVHDPAEYGAWKDYYDRWSTFRVGEDDFRWDITLSPRDDDHVITLPTFSKGVPNWPNTAL